MGPEVVETIDALAMKREDSKDSETLLGWEHLVHPFKMATSPMQFSANLESAEYLGE